MKTKIITLESHDDLVSVRDQLSWAKTERILLIWPKFEAVGLREFDLSVLQRHAGFLGAQLGLVTRRGSIRRAAQALGIPVFDSSREAQRDSWPARARAAGRVWRTPRRDLRTLGRQLSDDGSRLRAGVVTRVVAFLGGVAAVLSLTAVFLPRASLALFPEVRTQELRLPLVASTGASAAAGAVPLREITIAASVARNATVSGKITTPQSRAKGTATFTNLTSDPIDVPIGTIVYGQAGSIVRFATQAPSELPAGSGETVDLPIEAVAPGAFGNLQGGEIDAIEGALGLFAAVQNLEATAGGTDVTVVGATDEDREILHARSVDELSRVAEEQARELLASGDFLLSGTLRPSGQLSVRYDPAPGHAGTTLKLSLQGAFMANYLALADLLPTARAAADSSIPSGFVARDIGEVSIENVRVESVGSVAFDLIVRRTVHRSVDSARVFAIVQGSRASDVQAKLESELSLRRPADIRVQPSWWPWMPLVPFSLQLSIE